MASADDHGRLFKSKVNAAALRDDEEVELPMLPTLSIGHTPKRLPLPGDAR